MIVNLVNFNTPRQEMLWALLEKNGYSPRQCSLSKTVETIHRDTARQIFLIWLGSPSTEGKALYDLIIWKYPQAIPVAVSESYLMEDIRCAFQNGYHDYLPVGDLNEVTLLPILDRLSGFDFARQSVAYNDMLIHANFERESLERQLLFSLIGTDSVPISTYYMTLRRSFLRPGSQYMLALTQPSPHLEDCIDGRFQSSRGSLMNLLKNHLETIFEGDDCPHFAPICSIIDGYLVTLLCFKEPPEDLSTIEHVFCMLDDQFRHHTGIHLITGYSAPYTNLENTIHLFKNLSYSLCQDYFPEESTVFQPDENKQWNHSCIEIDHNLHHNLSIAASACNWTLLTHSVSTALEQFQSQNVPFSVAKILIYTSFLQFLHEINAYKFFQQTFFESQFYSILTELRSPALICRLFAQIQVLYEQLQQEDPDDQESSFQRVTQYIQKHYAEHIGLTEMAASACLNTNYFCSWFKKRTGVSFSQYLMQYRIEVAKKLLLQTDKKIYEVANEVGYTENVSFNRAFKKVVGMSPNTFRKISA